MGNKIPQLPHRAGDPFDGDLWLSKIVTRDDDLTYDNIGVLDMMWQHVSREFAADPSTPINDPVEARTALEGLVSKGWIRVGFRDGAAVIESDHGAIPAMRAVATRTSRTIAHGATTSGATSDE